MRDLPQNFVEGGIQRAAEPRAVCGGCGKANSLSPLHSRLFVGKMQRFALRSSLRSLPLCGKAAVAERKRRPKARCGMREPQPAKQEP